MTARPATSEGFDTMTTVKKIMLAALVAAGVVCGGSANAGFELRFDFISSGPNPPGAPTTPQFFYTLTSSSAPGNQSGIIDLWDGDVNTGPNLRLFYVASVNVNGMLTLDTVEVTWSAATVQQLDPIRFKLSASYDMVNVPGNPGDLVQLTSSLSAVGGANSSLQNPRVDFENPLGTLAASIVVFPTNVPLSTTPILTGGGTIFTNAGSTGKIIYSSEFTLAGFQNANISATSNLTDNIVPAPAGLILAGLGLPALGMARRFRRKATV
jgi:hypothetical protein